MPQEYTKRGGGPLANGAGLPARRASHPGLLLQRDGHDRLLRIVLYQQRRRMAGILHRTLELIDAYDRFAVDAQDDVTFADPGLGRRTVGLDHHDAATGLELALLV